ncbi:unnamed protein product [Rotaria sp. Silwood2]|nr:unnamed protein product [Rotaria sp. Silwood2]CAF2928620.1 unnamed protein product [Rotaria sp. Silwood2]CAF3850519.1 unnamed protein product [Rotaria sp. Silwood2]CAF4035406.1 unnamed protein product [Rotaria sp. Silwood2]
MKDTKTVLPMVNGNGENKNVFHHKNKTQENGNDGEHLTTTTITTTLKNGLDDNEELVGGCCVCSDDQGFANNALVYCDGKGCTVACHTACYGIVTIPDGDWYCGRCEASDIQAPCRLCPTIEGAMKRTSDGGWAHVVCALYIPEVSFGDDATMEPIILSKIPSTRFGQECSICTQNGRSKMIATSGACCGCTVKNCSQVFHVTCAQANGLLCEDVRKNNCQYPIYCEQHRPKLSKFIRQIQAFQYSPNALASIEQLKRQHLFSKEKDSPSQLSDFVAAAAAEAAASETNLLPSSTLDDTNNQTTSDEQQTPVSRAFYSMDMLKRKSSSNTNSSLSSSSSLSTPNSPIVQQKCHSRSSSSSSSSNSSLQKKTKLNDEMNNNNNNRSLNDLSQFVQLNKDERNFHPPLPNQSDDKEKTTVTTKSDSSISDIKEKTADSSKSSNLNHDHQSSSKTNEEKVFTSQCPTSSSNDNNNNNNNKSSIKQRHSTDTLSTSIKLSSIKKPITTKIKDDDNDEDYEINKKRRLSIKINKDGQPRKKRQHSSEGGPRPVGRPPSKKTLLAQQLTNGIKRPLPKSATNNNMKPQKVNDTLINISKTLSENDNDNEIKLKSRSTHYYPCDHFGNQINSDVFKPRGHSDEQLQQSFSLDTTEETSRSRVPSSSATTTTPRIDFYPRRPLQNTSTLSITTDQQQRTFPPQTLEEFLEQEWELSSDFLLQQTMPHDVSSLLSCLYQFKSENASLQKKFEELKHRRDSLRVTNANLRRRLSEILPINDTIPPPTTTATTVTAAISQVSPPLPSASSSSSAAAAPPPVVLPAVPPSPRKEQQQLKQQKLLAELELQQQLQQQKAISPSRRRLSINTNNQHNDTCQQTIKKSKSPRQTNSLAHQSLLENQLRQSSNNNNTLNTNKKLNITTIPNNKKVISSEVDILSHHQTTSTNSSAIPTTGSSTSTSSTSYEQIDVTATAAAAAYALAKNGRVPTNNGLSLELLSQILAASGTAISPQLFAPTWNISNFGYANFPGANPISVSDESIIRSYAPPTQPSLEQQQPQPSTKQQP